MKNEVLMKNGKKMKLIKLKKNPTTQLINENQGINTNLINQPKQQIKERDDKQKLYLNLKSLQASDTQSQLKVQSSDYPQMMHFESQSNGQISSSSCNMAPFSSSNSFMTQRVQISNENQLIRSNIDNNIDKVEINTDRQTDDGGWMVPKPLNVITKDVDSLESSSENDPRQEYYMVAPANKGSKK